METEDNNDNDATLTTSTKSSLMHNPTVWLAQRMMSTLEMYPQTELSREAKKLQLREWDLILCEVGPEEFDHALTEHIRESRFFPTVAELRERAGLSKADRNAVEANAAWEFVNRYVRRHWHPDIGPYPDAPQIPARIDYALRQMGGLRRLNSCLADHLPFMKKDFIEAYRLAPLAEARGHLSEAKVIERILLKAAERFDPSDRSTRA